MMMRMTTGRGTGRATGVAAALLAVLLAVCGAVPAAACEVCYGAADSGSPLVSGARLGVFLLLAVTAVVLGAFAKFFLYLRNRARQAEIEQIDSEWAQFQRSSLT
jgi:heme/copper-type cytochrome/quinol oxidase subunit 2